MTPKSEDSSQSLVVRKYRILGGMPCPTQLPSTEILTLPLPPMPEGVWLLIRQLEAETTNEVFVNEIERPLTSMGSEQAATSEGLPLTYHGA